MRRSLILITALFLVAAPAAAFLEPVQKQGDLDGNGDAETVKAERVDVPGADTAGDRTKVTVTDRCGTDTLRRRVAGPQDNLERLRLKAADTNPGKEVFAQLRSGAAGRAGEGRVVAWRRTGNPTRCRRGHNLFKYRSTRPTRSPMGATREVSNFDVRLKQVTGRFAGREVVLVEVFLRPMDPSCCGTIRKTSLYRYSHSRDRYVRYSVSVRR